MKRILILFLLLLLCLFAACGQEAPPAEDAVIAEPLPEEDVSDLTRVELDVTDEAGETYFNAAADMPDSLPEAVPEASLETLWAEADAFIALAEEEAAMAHAANQEWAGEYQMNFSLFHQDDEIVSITADLYSYSSQAAYATGGKKGYTFDAGTGDRLGIGTFLEGGDSEAIARVIASMIENAGEGELYFPNLPELLAREFRDDQWWTDGTTVYVFYPQGTIAPMTMGGLEFPIPAGKID